MQRALEGCYPAVQVAEQLARGLVLRQLRSRPSPVPVRSNFRHSARCGWRTG